MRKNPDLQTKFPSYYRQDLLEWRRTILGLSHRQIGELAKISKDTVKVVLNGKATSTKVYPVAQALGIDWLAVHDLTLKKSEFHLACNGGKAG